MLPKSPAAKPQWPPRSPHETLLSTPSGRARLRQLASQTSPSPLRRRTPHDALQGEDGDGEGEDEDGDEDEDEEMLQLKLQEIQAKLKLKKLQAKAKTTSSSDDIGSPRIGTTARSTAAASIAKTTAESQRTQQKPSYQRTVEVPASPVRRTQPAVEPAIQKSPRRVLLGIDKGLRGQDISLKRAPSARRAGNTGVSTGPNAASTQLPARPLSFNERLAAARVTETVMQDRKEKIQKIRTEAFSIGRVEMEGYKSTAVDIPVAPDVPEQFSREEIVGQGAAASAAKAARKDANKDEASFESYSGLHLTQRILPHPVVTRAVSGKKIFSLQDLLRDVKAPHFELPEVEADVVVMAIVASKSDPRTHKIANKVEGPDGLPSSKASDANKYMVVTLTDLKFQVDLFLFRMGFERYWKINTGTVVALLNPGVMPPPPGQLDTGRWSLVVDSDVDMILEIGTARDLGYCKSMKRNGQLCNAWINAKRTQFCEFHTNSAVQRSRSSRNDINSAVGFGQERRGQGSGGDGSWGRRLGGDRSGGGRFGEKSGKEPYSRNTRFDWEAQSQYFVAGASASDLLDRDGFADKAERKEGIKRRLVAKERETDIARKLSDMGSGAGRDYMKLMTEKSTKGGPKSAAAASTRTGGALTTSTVSTVSTAATTVSTTSTASTAPTYSSIADQAAASRASLLAAVRGAASGSSSRNSNSNASFDIQLGQPKRKRPPSVQSSLSAHSTQETKTGSGGFGWGTGLRDKLGRMREGEKLAPEAKAAETGGHTGVFRDKKDTSFFRLPAKKSASPERPERSPVRKKTRFLLGDKGIREAGRESLGTKVTGRDVVLEEDDDELVII